MSSLTRDWTVEPVSRDQVLGRERGQGNIHFPCSADHEQDWQPYPVDPHILAICVTIHTDNRGGGSLRTLQHLTTAAAQSICLLVAEERQKGVKITISSTLMPDLCSNKWQKPLVNTIFVKSFWTNRKIGPIELCMRGKLSFQLYIPNVDRLPYARQKKLRLLSSMQIGGVSSSFETPRVRHYAP